MKIQCFVIESKPDTYSVKKDNPAPFKDYYKGVSPMYHVHYYENKNLLLCQLLQSVPSEGEQLKIKGRKGTVLDVINIDENKFQVLVQLEVKKKKAALEDPKKKKKR